MSKSKEHNTGSQNVRVHETRTTAALLQKHACDCSPGGPLDAEFQESTDVDVREAAGTIAATAVCLSANSEENPGAASLSAGGAATETATEAEAAAAERPENPIATRPAATREESAGASRISGRERPEAGAESSVQAHGSTSLSDEHSEEAHASEGGLSAAHGSLSEAHRSEGSPSASPSAASGSPASSGAPESSACGAEEASVSGSLIADGSPVTSAARAASHDGQIEPAYAATPSETAVETAAKPEEEIATETELDGGARTSRQRIVWSEEEY